MPCTSGNLIWQPYLATLNKAIPLYYVQHDVQMYHHITRDPIDCGT
jgi:hypothetical protein